MATAHKPPTEGAPRASIVIPTRERPDYLRVALASIAPQAKAAGAELIVVDDAGSSKPERALAERFGARYEPHPGPIGLNAARNTGIERSEGDLVVFVDDDVRACEGWLQILLSRAREHPHTQVLAGAIVPSLEGNPPRSCGREGAPITSLQLGHSDQPTRYAWGANMAIRRAAFERVGPFDASLGDCGDEQEWQDRLRTAGDEASGDSLVLYVADAVVQHRRSAHDARLRSLCRASFARGCAARRFDAWRGEAPSLARELFTLAGCAAHVLLRRCPAGLTMVAHSAGRVRETGFARLRATPVVRRTQTPPTPKGETCDDFLSGESGTVGGLDGVRRVAADAFADAGQIVTGSRLRLDRAARRSPPTRRVLVIGVQREQHRELASAIRAELDRSRHAVECRFAAPGDRGKFENLNALLAEPGPAQWLATGEQAPDWLLVVDDDVQLPHGFVDRFLFLAERYSLDLAQPAHAHSSHAAWRVTRRQPRSAVRETRFVEIGPLSAFARRTLSTLLPFPEGLRMGWGLDAHWAALAQEHGWRCGVIDALAIRHRAAPVGDAYSREHAIAEARAFLADRPYLRAEEAQRTLATHRGW